MKKYALCGIGNAILDVLVQISEEEFASLNFEKGTMTLVDSDEQVGLLETFKTKRPALVSGGSVGNSVIAFSQLGGAAAFIGSIGSDNYGAHYEWECRELGIHFSSRRHERGMTGTCVVLTTPDAERTMRTHLGVAGELRSEDINEEIIASSEWMLVEGYLLANPTGGQPAVRRAVEIAKRHGTKIAATISAAFVVDAAYEALQDLVQSSDLLIANVHEAEAYTGKQGVAESLNELRTQVKNVAITNSAKGSHLLFDNEELFIEAFPCKAVDATGAGDMYTGALLYGITQGVSMQEAGRGASYLGMKVVTQIGARLGGELSEFWRDSLRE